jgi:hypothetical protein
MIDSRAQPWKLLRRHTYSIADCVPCGGRPDRADENRGGEPKWRGGVRSANPPTPAPKATKSTDAKLRVLEGNAENRRRIVAFSGHAWYVGTLLIAVVLAVPTVMVFLIVADQLLLQRR